jgi:hypothetical protein
MKKVVLSIITGSIIAISALSFLNLPQEYVLLEKVRSKLLDYRRNLAPEKTYLHTDKDFYTNGETIWFKTYLVDGITHDRSDKSKVVYVELVNEQDSVVAQRKLFVDNIGAAGDIQIAGNVPQGQYTLRSYTKYMLNEDEPVFFEKNIPILVQQIRSGPSTDLTDLPKPLEGFGDKGQNGIVGTPKVKFFPEGGHLVTGLPSTMGIEVLDANGNGVALKGQIRDSNNEAVTPFESFEFGLGSVRFIPAEDQRYHASIIIDGTEQKYPLPEALPSGYVLSIKDREDHLLVQVASTTEKGLEGTLLVGHLRGNMIFKRIGSPKDGASYATKIFTKELQDGVAQFTLFAGSGEPISERLVFIDHPENDARLTISAPAKTYGVRERVSLDMALTDEEGVPLKGNFSMGVVSKNGTKPGAANIKSWLLLDSDLGGSVTDPDYFFADGSKHRRFLLDALMLTHGWRRFVWKDMLSKKVTKLPEIAPEKGIMVTGRTTKFKEPSKPKQTVATLNLYGVDLINSKKETNEQGHFAFGPFYFTDSLEATVEAYDSLAKWDYKKTKFSILLDPQGPKMVPNPKKKAYKDRTTLPLVQEYLKEEYQRKVTDFKYDPTKVTQLEEVTVTAKDKKLTRFQMATNSNPMARMTTGPFSNRLFREDVVGNEAMSAMDLLNRVGGVYVTGAYPMQRVRIMGTRNTMVASGDPLILVNGTTSTLDFLQQLRAYEIEFIDVVRGPDTSIFGSRGASGVIGVYTNKSFEELLDEENYPGVVSFKIPGFYKTREFYTPDYAMKNPEKPDYRTTLYWKPELTFNDYGEATTDFFTGDKTGTFQVTVEGITDDGRPVNGIYDIEVMD